jgi:triosephosphate isomerase
MRKKITAGNWKMNLSWEEADGLANQLAHQPKHQEEQIVVFSPNIFLKSLIDAYGEHLEIGAQNGHSEDSGAYTGEVSFKQLRELGVKHVLVGHSERRDLFHESNELLKIKVSKAIELGFTVYFCCGEHLEDREADLHFSVIEKQLNQSLFHLSETQFNQVVIAYEPVWAIGTGKTATTEQAEEMHAFIRTLLQQKYSEEVATSTSILYGGSCKASNAHDLFSQPNIDGGLIGGASLQFADFNAIVEAQKIA